MTVHVDGGIPLVRCKHCGGRVKVIHTRQHLAECRAKHRRDKLGRMAFEKRGEKLYAIAVQRYNSSTGNWEPEMHYSHGTGPRDARQRFLWGESNHSHLHIVDVGLAIGMFALDRDGDQLVSD